jgi:cyclohexadieny/prephenate dehydrogenase
MSILFKKVSILGLGLLGGSVALAARKAGIAGEIVAWGRREQALAKAVDDGVVDAFFLDAKEAVRGADLVLLAVPVDCMKALLDEVAGSLSEGVLVSDVGSVKGELSESLPSCLPDGALYLGSHPMAGSHLRGVEHASADLFQGAACVVAEAGEGSEKEQEKLVSFWRALGGNVLLRDASTHDEEVAWVSHLPHAVSFAFADVLEAAPKDSMALAGSGFRDFTRIAKSDAAMWSEILVSNREALVGPIERVRESLAEMAKELASGDAQALSKRIEKGHLAFNVLNSTAPVAAGESSPDPEA